MTTRATIYLRQSSDREQTGDAVERQLTDCQRLCEREGLTVVRVITDNDTSASSRKPRPGYVDLLSDVEHGATNVVVAQTQDRLLRKPVEMEHLIDLAERTGTRVMLVRSVFDLTTAMGRASARQAAVWARLEVEQKAERQVRQAEQSAERGEAPSRRAFGYRSVKTVNGRACELDPAEAPLVREAFDRLLRGESLVSITKMLNASGLPSVRGNRWHRKGARYLLLSPRYAGLRVYRGQTTPGQWPALITADEHAQAVALLTDPARTINTRGTARRWLGSGLYRCVCGETVRIGYRSRANGSHRAYVCRSETHSMRRMAEPVDDYVVAVVEERLARPDVAELLSVADAPELAELRAEAAALARRADSARDRLDRGVLEEDEYVATKRTIKAEQDVIQRKITAAARTSRLTQLAATADPVEAFRALDLAARRSVIDSLMVVTLLPTVPGRVGLDPATIKIDWRE